MTISPALKASTSTPHARGSTSTRLTSFRLSTGYPACAGIHQDLTTDINAGVWLPRMRGDPPLLGFYHKGTELSTPHARGSTRVCQGGLRQRIVYPACAGIHLDPGFCEKKHPRLPRMRGDPPEVVGWKGLSELSTPHARGSTSLIGEMTVLSSVYPACAGIHPVSGLRKATTGSLPRMRGDPPIVAVCNTGALMSTPHARGSTLNRLKEVQAQVVYPACAGIHHIDL